MAEGKQTTLIAIDHGFSHIKTVDEIFETAISRIDEPISEKDVLQIGSKYYWVGGKRIDFLEDKTSTDDFRLLTYVAIARQLARLNTKKAGVTLAVGLPIGRMAKEKDDFKKYLSNPSEIRCGSDPNGLIPCMRRIDEECMRLYNTKLGETLIVDVIRGQLKGVEDKYVALIRDNLTRYAKNVFIVLKEMGIQVSISM